VVNLESGTLSPNKAPRQRSRKSWMAVATQISLVLVLTVACLAVLAGCGGVAGTYTDPSGSMVLELKSGGAATFSFMGQTAQCTYATSGNQVTVDCKGEAGKTVFTVQSDGSLAGPPGSLFPPLKKK
jgi:hypothetical protein